jgi:hypothetical protein
MLTIAREVLEKDRHNSRQETRVSFARIEEQLKVLQKTAEINTLAREEATISLTRIEVQLQGLQKSLDEHRAAKP